MAVPVRVTVPSLAMTTLAYDFSESAPADAGQPPVVLLHAGVCDRRMWDHQWDTLRTTGHRVLRLDLPGFGDSPLPAGAFNSPEIIHDLLDELGLDRVSLVGASFGGKIATEIAARWPKLVGTLVLVCAGGDAEPNDAMRAFGAREDALLEAGDVDAAVALNVDTWLGPLAGPEARDRVTAMQRRAFDVQMPAGPEVSMRAVEYDVAAITARTLAISGDHDFAPFAEVADTITAAVPGTVRLRLDWAGHLPSIEDPERFDPILTDFLANR